MDKKTVGLSIVSLTAAATLFGVSPAKAEDEVTDPGVCLKGCFPGGPPELFHKLEVLSTVLLKLAPPQETEVFHKWETAFLKIEDLFLKLGAASPYAEPPVVIGLD